MKKSWSCVLAVVVLNEAMMGLQQVKMVQVNDVIIMMVNVVENDVMVIMVVVVVVVM